MKLMKIEFFKVSEIVKQYINNHNKLNPNRKYFKCSGLTVNKYNEDPISISQLQTEGEIYTSIPNGTVITDKSYEKRINDFLQKSIQNKSDLVLTPEYSVPYRIIDSFTDQIGQLKVGSLFCLCSQGLENSKALDYINNIDKKKDCYVYKQALNNMDAKDFLCILFYIFKISFFVNENDKDDILFIIPQLKTTHMKDDDYIFETGHLSTGKDIFYFDIEPEQNYKNMGICSNIFYSLICSDVFQYTEYLSFMKNKNCGIIVFHPQLNPKPKHGVFLDFRKGIFDMTEKNILLITSTWGGNTKVNKANFNSPNSAIYEKVTEKNYIENNIELIAQNHISKITVGISRDRIKWLFPSDECYVHYSLLKPNIQGGSKLSTSVKNPFIYDINIYDSGNDEFILADKCLYTPKDIIDLINDKSPIKYDSLIHNICGSCDYSKCKIADFLYLMGSFFQEDNNKFIEYSLRMSDDEMCNQIRPDNKTQNSIRKNMILMRKLLKCIIDNKLPDDLFSLFQLGSHFYVKNGKRVKEIYNIAFDSSNRKLRFLCLDTKSKDEVKILFDRLSADAEEEEIDSTVLMYTDDYSLEVEFYHQISNRIDSDNSSNFDISKSDI